MKRSEAEAYLASGQECLRLRSDRDYSGDRVIIKGVGYKRSSSRRHGQSIGAPSPGAMGCLVDILRRDGTVYTQQIYPLSQLHPTTQAKHLAERKRRGEAAQRIEQERRDAHDAKLATAGQLVEMLGFGKVDVPHYNSGGVFVRLTLDEARALAEKLATS